MDQENFVTSYKSFYGEFPFKLLLFSPAATIYHGGFKNNYLKLIKICTFAADHWYLNIKSFRVRLAIKPKIITSLSVGTKSAQFIYSFLTLREKCPNTELFLIHIFPHSDWIGRDLRSLRIQSECGKIRTRNNSVFGHFSHSASYSQF